jgi:hypothetical protein
VREGKFPYLSGGEKELYSTLMDLGSARNIDRKLNHFSCEKHSRTQASRGMHESLYMYRCTPSSKCELGVLPPSAVLPKPRSQVQTESSAGRVSIALKDSEGRESL